MRNAYTKKDQWVYEYFNLWISECIKMKYFLTYFECAYCFFIFSSLKFLVMVAHQNHLGQNFRKIPIFRLYPRIRLPMQETWVQSLDQEDPLKEEIATHTYNLAWEIPWIEELGRPYIVHEVTKSWTQLKWLDTIIIISIMLFLILSLNIIS